MLELLMRQAWDYLDRPDHSHSLSNIHGARVFLRNPYQGLQYTKGEMRWGIAIQAILTAYMLFILVVQAKDYSLFNLVLSWWLLIANIAGTVTRVVIFKHLVSMKKDASMEELRKQMRVLFSKRVYKWNYIVTAICLGNYAFCLIISVFIWKMEARVPDLFIYSIIFMLRYFYSLSRYQSYFMSSRDARNPYGFAQFLYGDTETITACPKLAERDRCSICIQQYSAGCQIVEFPCSNGHYFHLDCMHKWLSVSLSCPLCKCTVFKD